jgi:hypothetical protein
LIQPLRYIDVDGTLTTNATTREVMIEGLDNERAGIMPLLGHPFLSAAYMMVNNDNNSFTLWQSNPTMDSRIVTLESSCQNQNISSLPPTTPHPPTRVLSKAAVVGIVIGAIAAAAIAGAVVWAVIHRSPRSGDDRQSRAFFSKAELSGSPVASRGYTSDGPHSDLTRPSSLHKIQPENVHSVELPADPI